MALGTWRSPSFPLFVHNYITVVRSTYNYTFGGVKKLLDLLGAVAMWRNFDNLGAVEFLSWVERDLRESEYDWRGNKVALEVVGKARGRVYVEENGEVRSAR
jgi:hypothetical protein